MKLTHFPIACLLLALAPFPSVAAEPSPPGDFESDWYPPQEKTALPDFRLVDTHDQVFGRERLKGSWSLIFLGYTQCPDICPTTLGILANAVRIAENSTPMDPLQVIFITVDPDRDTADVMKRYVQYFHPDFVGARGPLTEVRKLSSALQMFHYIARSEDGSRYTVSHSGDIAVVDPDGLPFGMISPPFDAQSIAADLQLLSTNR